MKHLEASARGETNASAEQCLAALRAVEEYPRWYPRGVRAVEVRERDADGYATKAHVVLHITIGPFKKDLPFEMTIAHEPLVVRLTRIAFDAADEERFVLRWDIEPGSPTTVRLTVDADLAVPRLVPTAGVGDAIASSLAAAAVAEIERG